MTDPLTITAGAVIAKIILDKFYEGLGTKLGEKAIEAVPAAAKSVAALGKLVWEHCFKGKPADVAELPERAGQNEDDLLKLKNYLLYRLDDAALVELVKPLADDLNKIFIENNIGTSQNIYDGGVGYVTNITGPDSTNFVGGVHNHGKK
jgi:hypothetical protein